MSCPWGITRAEVAGGDLNFFEDRAGVAAATIMRVLNEGENYGHSSEGQGKNVCVEFSSINIAKPFRYQPFALHSHRQQPDRIYKALGYNTIADNDLGDWGNAVRARL
ncbi:MAG: arginine--tRNA ligase [Christensenellales bacterium]